MKINEKQKGHGDREHFWGGCLRDNAPMFIFEFVHTVWEQSVSPDQTSKAEETYTPQPPTPEEVLSVWGPTFLSTQRRLARTQSCCLNLHVDPGLVKVPQPSFARPETGCTACARGFSAHVRPQGFSQRRINIHKYLYNSNASEMSNAFCVKQSHCCEPVLVRRPAQNLVLNHPLPPLYANIP